MLFYDIKREEFEVTSVSFIVNNTKLLVLILLGYMYVILYNKGFSFFPKRSLGVISPQTRVHGGPKGATIEMASKDKSSKKNVFEVINYCLSIILILNHSNFMF